MAQILLVDDTDSIREAVHNYLVLKGYSVITAVNGADAVEKADLTDIVVMDIGMPIMDGCEALRRIRAQNPEKRVVMMTAFDDAAGYRQQVMQDGAFAYLKKPLQLDALDECIRKALG